MKRELSLESQALGMQAAAQQGVVTMLDHYYVVPRSMSSWTPVTGKQM